MYNEKKEGQLDWSHVTCHVLRRNKLLRHVVEGKIGEKKEVTGRLGRRHKQQLDELKEMRRY